MSHAVFCSETVEVAARLDVDEPKLKRRMRPPRRLDRALRLDDGAEPAHFATSEERFKCVVLEDIDHLDQASRYSETSAATTTPSPPALLTGGRDAVNKTAAFTGWTQVHSREEYLGLRRLKHESNKKFLGMSSKAPPFALSPNKLAPSSRDGKPEPQSKKTGRLRLRKRCTIFCKVATMAKKRT